AAATATYEELGMTSHALRARALSPRTPPPAQAAPATNVFARRGDYWTVAYGGFVLQLKDGKGVRYIAELLPRPGKETHVLDRATAIDGAPDRRRPRAEDDDLVDGRLGSPPDVPDARARAEYRRRADELQDELEEAERNNDVGRISRL